MGSNEDPRLVIPFRFGPRTRQPAREGGSASASERELGPREGGPSPSLNEALPRCKREVLGALAGDWRQPVGAFEFLEFESNAFTLELEESRTETPP